MFGVAGKDPRRLCRIRPVRPDPTAVFADEILRIESNLGDRGRFQKLIEVNPVVTKFAGWCHFATLTVFRLRTTGAVLVLIRGE